MPKHPPLNPAVEARILGFIRAGGFPRIAAAAAGITRETFLDWLRRGKRHRAREPYRRFYRSVREAEAQARLHAETTTFTKQPLAWLRNGPGRETERMPGWTGNAKANTRRRTARCDIFASPEWFAIVATIRGALAPYPEAGGPVAEALANLGKRRKPDNATGTPTMPP